MAERRMFTKKVTDDDNFTSLSASAQALYLHLMMSADDDGFNNQISISMFRAHASVSDLEALLEKRYLYQFENGVIVIKHWRMANALRKDRYSPTTFQEEFKRLKIKENGAYTLNNESVVAEWLPSGCQVVATGKDRLGEVSLNIISSDDEEKKSEEELKKNFEEIYKLYPNKNTKSTAFASYKKWVQKSGRKVDGHTYHLTNGQIWRAVNKYVEEQKAKGTESKYYKNFVTLMNQILDYVEEEE